MTDTYEQDLPEMSRQCKTCELEKTPKTAHNYSQANQCTLCLFNTQSTKTNNYRPKPLTKVRA